MTVMSSAQPLYTACWEAEQLWKVKPSTVAPSQPPARQSRPSAAQAAAQVA